MKKYIVILLAIAFVATAAMTSFGRTMQQEMDAVRDYLNVVDAKLATAKQAHNVKRVKLLHAEKSASLARWEKLKNSMQTAPEVAPTPAPVTNITINNPPAPAATPVAKSGIGVLINTGLDAGLFGVSGNLDYDLSNLGAAGFKFRIGGNYVSGNNPNSSAIADNPMKAVSVKVGALYDLSKVISLSDMPMTYYVGAAYLIPVKVNNGRTGSWGVEAYVGANYMIKDFGMINAEAGYGALKYAANQEALKGIDLKIGYGAAF